MTYHQIVDTNTSFTYDVTDNATNVTTTHTAWNVTYTDNTSHVLSNETIHNDWDWEGNDDWNSCFNGATRCVSDVSNYYYNDPYVGIGSQFSCEDELVMVDGVNQSHPTDGVRYS